MLLEHIKRYDADKKVKLVSIDDIRTTNANIVKKIPSVPALIIMPSKEILFGKNVFDYLLLPPRGVLCNSLNKIDKKNLDTTIVSSSQGNQGIPGSPPGIAENDKNSVLINNANKDDDELISFSLGASSKYSDNFAPIEDESILNINRNYKWNLITEENDDVQSTKINGSNKKYNIASVNEIEGDAPSSKKQSLPSIEELMQQRDKDIL